jgi:hypothetical protein
MIISFFDNDYNRKAIADLKSNEHKTVSNYPFFKFDDSGNLILLSLSADGFFQNLIAPRILVEKLLKNGFPTSIREIEILVSDIDKDSPLLDYGIRLGREFLAQERELTIKISMNNEGQTLIIPPENKGGNWQVFLINTPFSKQQERNFEMCSSLPKKLIFEGNIKDFLQKDDCLLTPEDIAASAKRSAISKNPFYQPSRSP